MKRYTIQRVDHGYVVIDTTTNSVLKYFRTEKEAKKYIGGLE